MDERSISVELYRYLCKNIICSEEAVKIKRLLTNINDNCHHDKYYTQITSGSFGEGIEMKDSDVDIMFVSKFINVVEDTSNIDFIKPNVSYFVTDTIDTKPGFTKLRHLSSTPMLRHQLEVCKIVNHTFYLSSRLIKRMLSPTETNVRWKMHGPCLSDEDDMYDLAICVQCTSWISAAKEWITRPNNGWPRQDIKSRIINHGIHFVPIGIQGSPNEELEWRISFSVGEKLLIFSFNHTQLACYVLLKILLKDIISKYAECKDLLCSYFMKTILFWVSEEHPTSLWEPGNLIICFLKCFERLIYSVRHISCPHYFIPEINLFERKLSGPGQSLLLSRLNVLYTYGWECLLFSNKIETFPYNINSSQQTYSFYEESLISNIYNSSVLCRTMFQNDVCECCSYKKIIRKILQSNSSKIKGLYAYMAYSIKDEFEDKKIQTSLKMCESNKIIYKSYKSNQALILQMVYKDVVSGWLGLAKLFYKTMQYWKALFVLSHALNKCTPEKLYRFNKISKVQIDLLRTETIKSMPLCKQLRLLHLNTLMFDSFHDHLVSEEMYPRSVKYYTIEPLVFGHCYTMLCHFNLCNIRECISSTREIRLTIKKEVDQFGISFIPMALNILGKAYQTFNEFLENNFVEKDIGLQLLHEFTAIDWPGIDIALQLNNEYTNDRKHTLQLIQRILLDSSANNRFGPNITLGQIRESLKEQNPAPTIFRLAVFILSD